MTIIELWRGWSRAAPDALPIAAFVVMQIGILFVLGRRQRWLALLPFAMALLSSIATRIASSRVAAIDALNFGWMCGAACGVAVWCIGLMRSGRPHDRQACIVPIAIGALFAASIGELKVAPALPDVDWPTAVAYATVFTTLAIVLTAGAAVASARRRRRE